MKTTFPCGHPRTKENSYLCSAHSPVCRVCKKRKNREAALRRVKENKPPYPDRWERPLLERIWGNSTSMLSQPLTKTEGV